MSPSTTSSRRNCLNKTIELFKHDLLVSTICDSLGFMANDLDSERMNFLATPTR